MTLPRIIKFLKADIWRLRIKDLAGWRRFMIRLLRVVALTYRGLSEDRWQLRASALTYYSLLSIVPALAMAFGLAKGFGFEKSLETVLTERFQGQEEVVAKATVFAYRLLENVRGGLLAGIGLAILFWTCFRLLAQVEGAFNDVWGIKRGRSVGRKVADYLAVMLIGVLLLIMSSGLTVFITSEVDVFVKKITLLEALSPVIYYLLQFSPYLVIWLLFTLLYIFMPNTKVNFGSGVLAGIIAGTFFQLFQRLYINFQVGLSGYNAVYGSFAALPLFFIWLQFSWLIVLFGAEISCAHQNADTYEFELARLTISHAFKRLLSLKIVHLIIKGFSDRAARQGPTQIANHLEIPIPLVNQILFELAAAGVIAEVKAGEDGSVFYQPAVDPERITIKFVVEALESRGGAEVPVVQTEELKEITQSLRNLAEQVEKSPDNRRLKDI
ncbi:MAG: YhjD/YihY/BrkB family envelope integrity protein [Thermodesulfobacteriota bacterium]